MCGRSLEPTAKVMPHVHTLVLGVFAKAHCASMYFVSTTDTGLDTWLLQKPQAPMPCPCSLLLWGCYIQNFCTVYHWQSLMPMDCAGEWDRPRGRSKGKLKNLPEFSWFAWDFRLMWVGFVLFEGSSPLKTGVFSHLRVTKFWGDNPEKGTTPILKF